jgi:hypothetical protein
MLPPLVSGGEAHQGSNRQLRVPLFAVKFHLQARRVWSVAPAGASAEVIATVQNE